MGRVAAALIAIGAALLIAGNFASGASYIMWIGVGIAALGGAVAAMTIVFSPKSERSKAASPQP